MSIELGEFGHHPKQWELHVVRKAVDVGVPESFAWHQIWRALKDNADFFRQFVFWFLLAAQVRSPFAGLYTG